MNNKLELIKSLRREVEDLTTSKNNHDECLRKIQTTEDEIDNMKDTWSTDRKFFEGEWQKKLRISQIPIYIVFALISVYGFIKNNPGIVDFFLTLFLLEFSIAVVLESSMILFDICYNYQSKHQQRVVNRIRKYLFKKYPHIEKMYKDLCSLSEEIQAKRKHLEELKIEEQELQTKHQEICILLNSKNDELIKLEREYIDIVSSNNITNEVDTQPTITEGKGKTRVRKLENN